MKALRWLKTQRMKKKTKDKKGWRSEEKSPCRGEALLVSGSLNRTSKAG